MTEPRGRLAALTEGGQEALDDLIAPPLPHPLTGAPKLPGAARFRGVHKPKATPEKPVRDLPAPVYNAVLAGLTVINGPQGAGMQWKSRRRSRDQMQDPFCNADEYEVVDPWGDMHLVVQVTEAGLHKNIRKYSERVQLAIIEGKEDAARFFATRVAAIVHETLIT